MLIAAGLSQTWHHASGHRFFATARWSADQLGLCLLDLLLAVSVPADAPVRPVGDDTLSGSSSANGKSSRPRVLMTGP
jgi:hypothetical protein